MLVSEGVNTVMLEAVLSMPLSLLVLTTSLGPCVHARVCGETRPLDPVVLGQHLAGWAMERTRGAGALCSTVEWWSIKAARPLDWSPSIKA